MGPSGLKYPKDVRGRDMRKCALSHESTITIILYLYLYTTFVVPFCVHAKVCVKVVFLVLIYVVFVTWNKKTDLMCFLY